MDVENNIDITNNPCEECGEVYLKDSFDVLLKEYEKLVHVSNLLYKKYYNDTGKIIKIV